MTVYKVVLYLLLCTSCLYCSPVSVEQERLKILYEEHVESLKNFSCKTPQAMVFNYSDVLSEVSTNSLVHPPQTVLRRCGDTTGCCRKYYACRPLRVEHTELVFQLVNSFTRETRYIATSVEDHVECWCEKIANNTTVVDSGPS